jgi:hypothetical protein
MHIATGDTYFDNIRRRMEATNISKDQITVAFSPAELAFFSNAINETAEALEEWEFETRTGETRERAMDIMAELKAILREAERQ